MLNTNGNPQVQVISRSSVASKSQLHTLSWQMLLRLVPLEEEEPHTGPESSVRVARSQANVTDANQESELIICSADNHSITE